MKFQDPDFTTETLALTKQSLAKALTQEELAKAFVQSSSATQGLTQYSLEAPAKTLYPVLTPIRNLIPRSSGQGMGIQANWKAITGINTTAVAAGIGEGNRGGVISTTVVDYNAAFKGIGLDDNATFEAQYAAEGFDDVKARMSQGLLRSVMIAEEDILVGAQGSFGLGQTPTPTVAAVGSGGTIPNTTTVSVSCVALTMMGFNLARSPGAVNPVRGQVTKVNADGSTDVHGGFSCRASAEASAVTAAANSSVTAVVAPVRGACGYAWFVRTGGTQDQARLVGVTQVNSIVITAIPTTTQQLGADLVGNDRSQNNLLFDGMLAMCAQPALNSYYRAMPNGMLGQGTPLTADGAGGVVELDEACAWFWDMWRLGPDFLWVNSQQLIDLSRKVLAGGNTGAQRFMFAADQSDLTGGRMIQRYINPFNKPIAVKVHPTLPPGTMLFTTMSLPYQASGVQETMRVLCRRDYYQIDWPKRSRRDEYGVYADEVLQHYAPFSMGVISNIAKG